MRQSEYTDEQIIKAGNALLAESKRVTAFGIRNMIGGGNASRIKKVWDEYVTSQSVAAPEVLSELPVDVSERLEAVISELNAQIREMANQVNHVAVTTSERRVAEAVSEARERQESAEAELLDAAVTVEQLESRVDEGQQEIQKLNEMLKTLDSQVREVTEKNAVLSQSLAAKEKDLEVEQARSTELGQLLQQKAKENQEQAEKHQTDLSSIKSDHKQIVSDLKAAHLSAIDDLKAVHAEAVSGYQQATEALESRYQKELSSQEARHLKEMGGLNKRLELSENSLGDLKTQFDQAQVKYQETTDQILVLAAERDNAKEEAAKLREEGIVSAQAIKELKSEVKKLTSANK